MSVTMSEHYTVTAQLPSLTDLNTHKATGPLLMLQWCTFILYSTTIVLHFDNTSVTPFHLSAKYVLPSPHPPPGVAKM